MKIPSLILKQLYNFGSLHTNQNGFRFSVKNRLNSVTVERFVSLKVDHQEISIATIRIKGSVGELSPVTEITPELPYGFPLRETIEFHVSGLELSSNKHKIEISFVTKDFGELKISVEDSPSLAARPSDSVPHDKDNDYNPDVVSARQQYVSKLTGVEFKHLSKYSFDPATTRGNIENFTGVAQIPIGIAGPLRINGEHAQGEFIIPMATTEGTLVASYNRGMKALNLAGGVRCTVQADCMQRAPVFIFQNARDASRFAEWVQEHMETIRDIAEATSSIARLLEIDTYLSNKFAFLRFNYTTGDAAGQNMVGRATFAACSWILEQIDYVERFFLESNLATDKKSSQINVMRTRGKRVTAEATISRDILEKVMRVSPESLVYHANIANVGTILSGANNNGAHSPNGITAMFIATGQDVANVAESSAAILYSELTPEKNLYCSITIPSLIVATHGGGTGLATQNECLKMLGCTGPGSVKKLAEIVAGVVLAGELSLASAISSLDWVSSHERYGRNR